MQIYLQFDEIFFKKKKKKNYEFNIRKKIWKKLWNFVYIQAK